MRPEVGWWGDLPPWERPGAVRRDCEPDRAWMLGPMGGLSLLGGVLSLLPCLVGVAPAALALSCTTWLLARQDLGKMRAGRMDPRGRKQSEWARDEAMMGLFFTLLAAAFWGGIFVLTVAL
jgi:hypothetical protein